MDTPFLDALPLYQAARYPGIIPLPARKKAPPPTGRTGGAGVDFSGADLYGISEEPEAGYTRKIVGGWMTRDANIGWRVPPTILGIDVDDDPKGGRTKSGRQEIADLEKVLGPLPPTVYSSNRGADSGSRHLIFRIEGDVFLDEHTKTEDGTAELLPSVEFIQNTYRFLVVAPSIHPSGRRYVWYLADGTPIDGVPDPELFAFLPQAWVDRFRGEFAEAVAVSNAQAQAMLQSFPADGMCSAVRTTLTRVHANLDSPGAARQPVCRNGVLSLLRMGEMGHHGVPEALEILRNTYVELVGQPGEGQRDAGTANGEYHRMVHGTRGIGLLLATPSPDEKRGCKCITHRAPLPEPVDAETWEAFVATFATVNTGIWSNASPFALGNRTEWLREALTKDHPDRRFEGQGIATFTDVINGRYTAGEAVAMLTAEHATAGLTGDPTTTLRACLAAALANLEGAAA